MRDETESCQTWTDLISIRALVPALYLRPADFRLPAVFFFPCRGPWAGLELEGPPGPRGPLAAGGDGEAAGELLDKQYLYKIMFLRRIIEFLFTLDLDWDSWSSCPHLGCERKLLPGSRSFHCCCCSHWFCRTFLRQLGLTVR